MYQNHSIVNSVYMDGTWYLPPLCNHRPQNWDIPSCWDCTDLDPLHIYSWSHCGSILIACGLEGSSCSSRSSESTRAMDLNTPRELRSGKCTLPENLSNYLTIWSEISTAGICGIKNETQLLCFQYGQYHVGVPIGSTPPK